MNFMAMYLPSDSARCVALLGLLLVPLVTFSQEPPPESFFPHHLGDTWVYFVLNGAGDDTLIVSVVGDSAGADGQHYVRTSRRELTPLPGNPQLYPGYDEYRLDTLGHVYTTRYPWRPYGVFYYDLGAPVGKVWVTDTVYETTVHIAKIRDYYPALVFEQESMIKWFDYYTTGYIDDTTMWVSEFGELLASGFGVVYRAGADLGYRLSLMAASIGGAAYGDTALLQRVMSVDEDPHQSLPEKISLAQNYPNPFNASTWIEFSLPQREHIAILVYDVLGREVAALANSSFSAGTHRVQWRADGAASGVYFCVLKTSHALRTREMIIQR